MIVSANDTNLQLRKAEQKLSVQCKQFADDSIAIRSLDWDRNRFDILIILTFNKGNLCSVVL